MKYQQQTCIIISLVFFSFEENPIALVVLRLCTYLFTSHAISLKWLRMQFLTSRMVKVVLPQSLPYPHVIFPLKHTYIIWYSYVLYADQVVQSEAKLNFQQLNQMS